MTILYFLGVSFNPCFIGFWARSCIADYDTVYESEFQSLFYWILGAEKT